jgi:hypothetical protein
MMELVEYVYSIYILNQKDKKQKYKRLVEFQMQYYQLMVKVWDFLLLSIEMQVEILIGGVCVILDSINKTNIYIAFYKIFKMLSLIHLLMYINIALVECITYEVTDNEIMNNIRKMKFVRG